MSLRKSITRTVTSSATMTAIVEDIAQIGNTQLATVRLQGSGNRMTNLQVVGGQVAVGDSVTVDMSSGSKPYIRPNTPAPTTIDSVEYEEMLDTFEDNTDDIDPTADYATALDKLLKEASKSLVCKIFNGDVIVNTLGATILHANSIAVPMRGIYWVQTIVTVGEGTPSFIFIDLEDIDSGTSYTDDNLIESYYPDNNLIGGVYTYNVSSVVFADEGDIITAGHGGASYWTIDLPSVIQSTESCSQTLSVVLINPGSDIGYNAQRSN